jgi:hypothetical protein
LEAVRLNYSILVIARLFALALAPSTNFKKQMRLGIGDPGASAALESGFAKTIADGAAGPDTDGRDDGALIVKIPTPSGSISPPSCRPVYLYNSADQCKWVRAC